MSKERTIVQEVKGSPAVDGAGVHLVRVLGRPTIESFDPFLMLDSFDSTNPDDYTKGFPLHPHRGIETISYISSGAMKHRDSIGNEDTVIDGQVQWMTAGSGIMHEETLPATDRMLGVQLWLNMAADAKMSSPDYHALKGDDMPIVDVEGGTLKVIAGEYDGATGFQAKHTPLTYYALKLEPGASITLPTDPQHTVFVFTLTGEVSVGDHLVGEKTAALTDAGDSITITAGSEPTETLFLSGRPLRESVAWGGPVVMNTQEELHQAFAELERGTFIKESIEY